MLQVYESMARRIRIRSWKDLVLIIVAAVIIFGLQWLLKKFMPNMSEKTVNIISYAIGFVIILIGVFAVGD